MRKFAFISLALLIVGLISSTSFAATSFGGGGSDSPPTVAMQIITKILSGQHDGQFLDKKVYADGGIRVVFVTKGRRYTVYYTGQPGYDTGHLIAPSVAYELSFSVRPNGTTSSDLLMKFTDLGLDGMVDSGIFGSKNGQRRFDKGTGNTQKTGLKYLQYWQDEYDSALSHTIKYLLGVR